MPVDVDGTGHPLAPERVQAPDQGDVTAAEHVIVVAHGLPPSAVEDPVHLLAAR